MIYADIIIDISSDKLDRSFQYRVPERLEKKIKAGMVAAIPFGNAGRVRKGYVIGLSDKPQWRRDYGIQTDRPGSLDERKLWFHHDPGSQDSTSYPGENQGKREKIYMPGYFRRGGNAVAERT